MKIKKIISFFIFLLFFVKLNSMEQSKKNIEKKALNDIDYILSANNNNEKRAFEFIKNLAEKPKQVFPKFLLSVIYFYGLLKQEKDIFLAFKYCHKAILLGCIKAQGFLEDKIMPEAIMGIQDNLENREVSILVDKESLQKKQEEELEKDKPSSERCAELYG